MKIILRNYECSWEEVASTKHQKFGRENSMSLTSCRKYCSKRILGIDVNKRCFPEYFYYCKYLDLGHLEFMQVNEKHSEKLKVSLRRISLFWRN